MKTQPLVLLKEDTGVGHVPYVFVPVPSSWILTANLQFTLHYVFAAVVHRFACIHSSVEQTGLADLQRQDTLLAEHSVLGFVRDVHLVLVPGHFGLTRQDKGLHRVR